jgi:hypothetical protein
LVSVFNSAGICTAIIFPFALIKINKDNKNLVTDNELKTETATIKINIPNWMVI